ncbi:MAG: TRAP transporter substrate-binding protein [Alphaproteobacteria bacterium]|nr:MAG: TRAP transporter substrate-binding protein [Alphaproteobacteria bacterium]
MAKRSSHASRRAFLLSAGLTSAAAAAAALADGPRTQPAGGPAVLRRRRSLKLVTAWPKNAPGLGVGAERIAQRINALSDGSLDVRLFAGGELVPALGGFDAVAQGKADMYHAAEYYWQGKSPAFNFFTAVPFGMTAAEMNAWLYFGGGQALWDELAAGFGIKAMPAGNTGHQTGGWFKRAIRSLDDFKGLRMRMPGLGGEVISAMGATPVTKPGGELFLALSQGNIDATEWVGPWNDMALGFHTIAPYYYGPGFHEPGSTLSLGVNLGVWQELSDAQRAVVAAAAAAENDLMLAEYNYKNARALNQLAKDHGIVMRPFPDDVMLAAAQAAGAALAALARGDAMTARVADSFMAARRLVSTWLEASDFAYMAARRRDAG